MPMVAARISLRLITEFAVDWLPTSLEVVQDVSKEFQKFLAFQRILYEQTSFYNIGGHDVNYNPLILLLQH